MALIHSDDLKFKADISKGLVLVDFFATWCGPCRMQSLVLEELKDDYQIVKIDTDAAPKTASEYAIMSIPSLLLFKDGELVAKQVGYLPKDLLIKWIEQYR